jgi:hypothetical protein
MDGGEVSIIVRDVYVVLSVESISECANIADFEMFFE